MQTMLFSQSVDTLLFKADRVGSVFAISNAVAPIFICFKSVHTPDKALSVWYPLVVIQLRPCIKRMLFGSTVIVATAIASVPTVSL